MAQTIDQCFSIDYVNRRIYDPGTYNDVFTVRQLYSYLQNTFDELTQLDDTIPMSAQTPTDFTLINGWFIDDTTIKYLKGGAITTSGWASGGIRQISFNASTTAFSSSDIGATITGTTTGHTGTVLAYDARYGTNLGVVWIRPTSATDTFNNATEAFTVASPGGAAGNFTATFNASGSASGETIWPNIYTLGTIDETYSASAQQIYIIQYETHLTEWWPDPNGSTRHIDVLIKTQEVGTAVDSGNLTVFLRHYPSVGTSGGDVVDLYDHFGLSAILSGRNAVPLATANDLNNLTATATIGALTGIVIAFVNGSIAHGEVTGGPFTALETVTSNNASPGSAIMISDGSGPGPMVLGNVTGTFASGNVITGSTSGATATATANLVLDNTTRVTTKAFNQGTAYNYSAIIDCGTNTLANVYEYLKYYTRNGATGSSFKTYTVQRTALSAWASNQLDGEQYIGAYEDLFASANTYAPVKQAPFGSFAGGKFFGARGIWLQNMAPADVQAFQLVDSDGNTRTPPVQISITVSNTLASDRVAVFQTTSLAGSTTIWKDQFSSHATNNTTGSTSFIVTSEIPSDTPTSGSLRTVDVSDTSSTRETRYTYTTWSGSTFGGITATLGKTYASSDTAYVPYLDTEASGTSASTTVIYSSNRYVLTRVRRYATSAILPFEVTGTIISTGYSQATIRTTDSIVQ